MFQDFLGGRRLPCSSVPRRIDLTRDAVTVEQFRFGLWRHSSIHLMARLAVVRPKASRDEVRAHRAAIRRLVDTLGLGTPRIRGDGTVIVHSQEAGYRAAARLSAMASDVVGRDVHVITDDVAGAAGAQEL